MRYVSISTTDTTKYWNIEDNQDGTPVSKYDRNRGYPPKVVVNRFFSVITPMTKVAHGPLKRPDREII